MIRPGTVWDIAKAEMRLTRRLARFWVFQVIAFLAAALFYLQYNVLHLFFSSLSGSAAMVNPRFLMSFIGMWYLVVFLLGIVFLGFEIRARDKRENIVEVFDALPVTNLELITGRFVGILLACWFPALVSLILLSLIGFLGFQTLPLPTSLISWLLFMAPPAYGMILGLTFFLTLVLRHRWLAGIVVTGVVIGLAVVNLGLTPVWMLPAFDITGVFMLPPMTDFAPSSIDLRSFSQRAGYMLFAFGFLLLCAVIHPRKDDANKGKLASMATACFVVGAAVLAFLVYEGKAALSDQDRWFAVHDARAEEPAADLQSIVGTVDISAKKSLSLDLALNVQAPEGETLSTLLFTLNPGLTVNGVSTDDGATLTYRAAEALLEIDLDRPLGPGASRTINLMAGGKLDPWFGYIDADVRPLGITMKEGNLFALGFLNSLTERGVVALMPGSRWLPQTGTDVGRGGRGRPVDFFTVDLTVKTPSGWLVAGPSRRQEAGDDTFRFTTVAPVPEVALVASNYTSHSAEIDGVMMEILVHPRHTTNIDVFADAGDLLGEWISKRLQQTAELGLEYPYDSLTMVEVPSHLRGYGGGWRLDTTLTQPAMILTRESGFSTARFDRRFKDPDRYKDHEEGVPGAKRDTLTRFFTNDFTGGNPFLALARSYFGYQTRASGDLAIPLDFVYEDLTNQLVSENRSYFSARIMTSQTEMNQIMGSLQQMGGEGRRGRTVSDIVIDQVTSRSDVWSTALETSLAELNPWETPKESLNVLTLKGGAMAQSLMDGLGSEKAGAMVASLRDRGVGGSFDEQDVAAVGEEIGVDLQGWMDRWLHDTALPGFIAVNPSLERITDDEDGTPNYQLLVKVHNGEAVGGMVKLQYVVPSEGGGRGQGRRRQSSDPIEIPANGTVEIGIVTSQPPRFAFLSPYLSLNRDGFSINLPSVDEELIVDAEPFIGSRIIEWQPTDDGSIIVDDLDEGFSVADSGETGMRLAGRGVTDEDTDGGLPVTSGRTPSRWSRRETALAYGRYRHTVATIKAGDGSRTAEFTAEIPSSGLWELSYYVPSFRRRGSGGGGRGNFFKRGTWQLAVEDSSGVNNATLDADGADPGWNILGEYEIAAGETVVRVGNEATEGRYVVADAIRWIPVKRNKREEAEE
ncbi:MAG: hypothetical protein OEV00_02265 [Acidobacteriota bacterium]|nr:hypothetical protein [Acidobacteriota bacterium]MDH3784133.1 hypothetical protein [Acidobacteriota bacterium]